MKFEVSADVLDKIADLLAAEERRVADEVKAREAQHQVSLDVACRASEDALAAERRVREGLVAGLKREVAVLTAQIENAKAVIAARDRTIAGQAQLIQRQTAHLTEMGRQRDHATNQARMSQAEASNAKGWAALGLGSSLLMGISHLDKGPKRRRSY